ncbi:MAG TPA: hypothetical protein VHC42_04900 [Rhizomicrobium sp.]|nr:hypothetical protein [Rhizomicrobium sp.]
MTRRRSPDCLRARGRKRDPRIMREDSIALALEVLMPEFHASTRLTLAANLANEREATARVNGSQLWVGFDGVAGQSNRETYLRHRLAGTHPNQKRRRTKRGSEDENQLLWNSGLIFAAMIARRAQLCGRLLAMLTPTEKWPTTVLNKLAVLALAAHGSSPDYSG